MATSFATITDKFLGKITDDMYLEMTEEDTLRDSKQILLDAIPYFEFPRFKLYAYDVNTETYTIDLTDEEINILALLMKANWLERQINSIENTRMKYSGSDFKFTSQANHLAKLLQLKTENLRESTHAQRLYKRRRWTDEGDVKSNWNTFNYGVYRNKNGAASGNGSNDSNIIYDQEDIEWIPIDSNDD